MCTCVSVSSGAQSCSFQWTLRTDLLLDGLFGSPCRSRDSQESSPTQSIKSLVLSFLYSPTLTSHNSHISQLSQSNSHISQLSHPHMTTGKTIALTRRTFVDKVMSLLFNMLSRLVTTFLLRSRCLLISWLQSPSAVIL